MYGGEDIAPSGPQLALRIFRDELLQISAVGAVGADSCGGIRISMRPTLAQRWRTVPGLNVAEPSGSWHDINNIPQQIHRKYSAAEK